MCGYFILNLVIQQQSYAESHFHQIQKEAFFFPLSFTSDGEIAIQRKQMILAHVLSWVKRAVKSKGISRAELLHNSPWEIARRQSTCPKRHSRCRYATPCHMLSGITHCHLICLTVSLILIYFMVLPFQTDEKGKIPKA